MHVPECVELEMRVLVWVAGDIKSAHTASRIKAFFIFILFGCLLAPSISVYGAERCYATFIFLPLTHAPPPPFAIILGSIFLSYSPVRPRAEEEEGVNVAGRTDGGADITVLSAVMLLVGTLPLRSQHPPLTPLLLLLPPLGSVKPPRRLDGDTESPGWRRKEGDTPHEEALSEM